MIEAYDEIIEDCCEKCEYYRPLKHNFKQGVGHEESHACVIFVEEKNAFVLEVEPDDVCEMFTERNTNV